MNCQSVLHVRSLLPASDLPPAQAEAAQRLVRETGHDTILKVTPLTGGANNRVYRLQTTHRELVLKHYFRHPTDSHDRLKAEYAFVTTSWAYGIRCIPRAYGNDSDAGLALYEFVDGQTLHELTPEKSDVEEAAAFLHDLQHVDRDKFISSAADACFSTADHITSLDRRLTTLHKSLRLPAADITVRAAAENFVNRELTPAWEKVRSNLVEDATPERGDELVQILSPSDFGFHNALRTRHGLIFLDFEYAGYDDPAKTLCDFICQPSVPVPESLLAITLHLLANAFTTDVSRQHALLRRTMRLLPVHHIKWCCIMLNDFKQTDDTRRHFAAGGTCRLRHAAQLNKARNWLHTQRFSSLYEVFHGLC